MLQSCRIRQSMYEFITAIICSLDNRIHAGVYWTSEVNKMIDKDMLEAIGELLAPIIKDQREIREDLQAVKADVAQIPDMRRDINLLLEGQQGINEKFSKLDQMAEDVEEIKIKVSALEEVSRSQASQIREIRLAK